jgi:hypothetical protein
MAALALQAAGNGPVGLVSAQDQVRRPVVAILDFTNSSLVDHATYEPFTVGVAGMLLAELRQNPRIELVERERLRQVLDEIDLGQSGRVDAGSAARAGKILGADHIIFGVFVIDRRGNLRLDARAVNVETSRVEHVETVSDDADNLIRAVQKLGQQLSNGLRLPAAARPAGREGEAARKGQVLTNLKVARAMQEEDRRNAAAALALYRAFLVESPPDYAPALRRTVEERIRVLTAAN